MMDDNTIITLDNNQRYTIVSKINYENNNYIYLANIDTTSEFIIGKVENDEIVIIKEQPLLSNLILTFAGTMKDNN